MMQLTLKQAEVLRLMLAMRTNKEIAKELGVSLRTVGFHTRSIYRKHNILNQHRIHSRIELFKLYGEFEVTVTWRSKQHETITALPDSFMGRGSNPERPLSAADFREPTSTATKGYGRLGRALVPDKLATASAPAPDRVHADVASPTNRSPTGLHAEPSLRNCHGWGS